MDSVPSNTTNGMPLDLSTGCQVSDLNDTQEPKFLRIRLFFYRLLSATDLLCVTAGSIIKSMRKRIFLHLAKIFNERFESKTHFLRHVLSQYPE